ncbi:MAG: methylenetetrahydrofolate--tRNA-(uracil(54)-C(5))-methyltransferase (FADH(2)-oxidizing) TrmFO [Anaerolineales bacterium]
MPELMIIGGGLAGSEAAWQAAERGVQVKLYEMRPDHPTGAHVSSNLAELVCSNSLGSNLPDRAPGLLKEEMRRLGSLLLRCAEETAVPAGGALAVGRDQFAALVTKEIEAHQHIQVIREEITSIPDQAAIIATGPLTSDRLSQSIAQLTGHDHLYFFDAISPIVTLESINLEVAYKASRYDRGENQDGDYINCPMNTDEYYAFIDALVSAERIELKSFELNLESGVRAGAHKFFEGCLPIEVLACRGRDALSYGPMRPVGLIDRRTGNRPYAVLQLRQDNIAGTLYNLVGFQTNLKFAEQRRIFRMIPGLEYAEFVRYGQMHRNTFIYSPAHLRPTLQARQRDNLFFAGQITGVEGYAGNIATGLLAGINAARVLAGESAITLPPTTMLGALCHYITHADAADFQPMKANFGILPPLDDFGKGRRNKRQRASAYVARSLRDFNNIQDQFSLNLLNAKDTINRKN